MLYVKTAQQMITEKSGTALGFQWPWSKGQSPVDTEEGWSVPEEQNSGPGGGGDQSAFKRFRVVLAQEQPAQPPSPQPQQSLQVPQADYCVGLSINADLFWDQSSDVTFLTFAGKDALIGALHEAAVAGHMKIVDSRLTTYGQNPQFGFSYLVVLGQSHIMIHTWPEKFFMNIDIFTCGSEGDPLLIFNQITSRFKPVQVEQNQVQRGVRKDIKSAVDKPDAPANIQPVGPNQVAQ